MNESWTLNWLALALDVSVKSLIVFAVMGSALLLLRRASAASRHVACLLAFLSLLCLPVLSLALPGWQAPISPLVPALLGEAVVPAPVLLPAAAPEVAVGPPTFTASPAAAASPEEARVAGDAVTGDAVASDAARLPRYLFVFWLAGTIFVLSRVAAGLAGVYRIGRRSRRMADGPLAERLTFLARTLGVTRRVTLLAGRPGKAVGVPMTWGVWRPVILLPADADQWPLERLRAVLLHELAHVRRGDWLTHLLAYAACAFYWFHPLAWLAAGRLWMEAERACDDCVLLSGIKAPNYAEHLLEVIRSMKTRKTPIIAVPMAHRSQVEGRLRAILDAGRNRRTATRRALVAASLLTIGLLVPLAALRPPANAQEAGAGPAESREKPRAPIKKPQRRSEADMTKAKQDFIDAVFIYNTIRPKVFKMHEVYNQRANAIKNKDDRVYMALLAPEFSMTLPGGQVRSRRQVEEDIRQRIATTPSPSQKLELERGAIKGNQAVVTVHWASSVVRTDARGVRRRIDDISTMRDTWIKTTQGWKLQHTALLGTAKKRHQGTQSIPNTNKGYPANGVEDLKKIYAMFTIYRSKHGTFPAQGTRTLFKDASARPQEYGLRSRAEVEAIFLNPDTRYAENVPGPMDGYIPYAFFARRPDGSPVGAPKKPGTRDVLAHTSIYVRKNIRYNKLSTMRPEGVYLVLWEDGQVEQLSYNRLLFVPEPGGRLAKEMQRGLPFRAVMDKVKSGRFRHAFPGQAGVPAPVVTFDEYYGFIGGRKKG